MWQCEEAKMVPQKTFTFYSVTQFLKNIHYISANKDNQDWKLISCVVRKVISRAYKTF